MEPERRPFDVLGDWLAVAFVVVVLVLVIQWVQGLFRKDGDCTRHPCPEGQVSALVERECRCVKEPVE